MIKFKINRSILAVFVVAMLLMAAFLPGTLQAGTSTAVWTTNSNGSAQNENHYDYWEDVYVKGNNLEAEYYYIRVTKTNGDVIAVGVDPIDHLGTGAFGPTPLPSLLPDFNYQAGVYKVWICPNSGFSPSDSKTDNFSVAFSGTPDDPKAYLEVVKASETELPANGFPYTITGDGVNASGSITSTGSFFGPVQVTPGHTYTITEDVSSFPGWSKSFDCDYGQAANDDYQVAIPTDFSSDITITVTITNTYEEESEYGKLYIKKIVNGNGPDGPYEVSLCPTGSPALRVADNGSADDNCIYLEIYKNQENSFKNEAYEFWGWYYVSEYGPVNNNHQGYLVYLSDSNWDYDPDSPIAGDGEEGFQVPDENTPVNLDDPYADVYLVIVNYFKGDTPPGEPELIVKKRIGSGTSTQKYYNAELQKWVCPYLDRVSIMEEGPDVGECSWETIRSFQIAVGEPWSMTLADIYDEYDYGQYRVIETDTGTISNWTSLSYTVDGQSGNEFEIYGEETADIILEVTNNFRTGGGGGGDTWPRLTVEKQIGEGTSTQNTYTVELQKLDDNEWSTKDTFAISPGSSKSVSMQAYGSGTYRIVEINTDQIKNFKSVSYSVSGDPADNSNEFKVSLNGRSSTVTVTNNFKDGDEDITTTEPEPAVPFIPAPEVPEIISIPEPAPALPKTGAAPMAAGLGLILAAGGLAIRRIRK